MGSQIKVDIDRKVYDGKHRIEAVISMLGLKTKTIDKRRSRSGNFHWQIEIEEILTPVEIVCIQSLMGSDFKRECFNLMRAVQLKDKSDLVKKHWNVLFNKEDNK
jgi:hypothetical protein